MPDCPYTLQVHLLADGELNSSDAAALREHLRTCDACAKRYAEYTSLSALLSDTMEEPSADFTKNVMAQILAEAEEKAVPIQAAKKPKKRSGFAPLLTAAACLALIIGVVAIAGRGLPTAARVTGGGNQTAEVQMLERGASAEDAEPVEPTASAEDAEVLDTAVQAEGQGALAAALGVSSALDEETTAAIRALLKDGDAIEAPELDENPVCTLADQEKDTLLWIDGKDVIYTEDGVHYFRIEKLAKQVQKLLNAD